MTNIDTEKLADMLDLVGDNLCDETDAWLEFATDGDGITCTLARVGNSVSSARDRYPYGPDDGLDCSILPFRFTVQSDAAGAPRAWTDAGSKVLGSLDIEGALIEAGLDEHFAEISTGLAENGMDEPKYGAEQLLLAYAQHVRSSLSYAVWGIGDNVADIVSNHADEIDPEFDDRIAKSADEIEDALRSMEPEEAIDVMRRTYRIADQNRAIDSFEGEATGRAQGEMFCEMTAEYLAEAQRALAEGNGTGAVDTACRWASTAWECYPLCLKLIDV